MKFTIHNIFLLSSLLLTSAATLATASSDTDAYIAALTQFLEQKTIGDAELVTMFEAAEDGRVVNPILPVQAETSVEHHVANEALKELLQGEIDAARVAAWAVTQIKEQDRVRKKRKQTQDETKQLWQEIPSVLTGGFRHSCAVTIFGTIRCWGDNDHGQASPPAGIFKSVSGGQYHSCGLRVDGRVECWGWDNHMPLNLPSDIFQSVSAAAQRACGVTVDGILKCWGTGQPSPEPTGGFKSVSARRGNTCGLKLNGTVACWESGHPVATPAGIFQSVSAGDYHACGVRANGSIQCWGSNHYKQCDSPPGVFQSVSAGEDHNCGLKVDGTVLCWGEIETAPLGVFHSISSGFSHTCGVRMDGRVECWGSNDFDQSSPPSFLLVLMSQTDETSPYVAFIKSLIQRFRSLSGF